MFKEKYYSILEQSESYRKKWAFGLSMFFSVIILFAWSVDSGWVKLNILPSRGQTVVVQEKTKNQMAAVVTAPSPIESASKTFQAGFSELNKKFNEFKDTVYSVMVPFISNVEIYQRQ